MDPVGDFLELEKINCLVHWVTSLSWQEYVDLGKEILEYAAHLHQLVGTAQACRCGWRQTVNELIVVQVQVVEVLQLRN